MTRASKVLLAVIGFALVAPMLLTIGLLPAMASTGEVATGADSAITVRVLTDESREDVADVTVRVLQDGAEVATGTTGDDGTATIELPGPGTYGVEVDLESLTGELAGLGLAENPITTEVRAGQPRTVAFRLGRVAAEDGGIAWNTLPQLLAQGLRFGLILALAAIGLSLVFGTTGLTNFAHGEYITFGALSVFGLTAVIGLPFALAALITVLVGAGFGWLQDAGLWGPLRRRGTGLIAMMIVSIGLSFVLRFGLLYVAGGDSKTLVQFATLPGLEFLGTDAVRLRTSDLASMGLAAVVLVLVGLGLLYTRVGKATRAVRDNPALAATTGIDVDRVIRVVWTVGTALAALGGVLLILTQGANYLTGFQILLLVFAAVVLGGLGTAFGTMVGAILVGILLEVSTLVVPTELRNATALAVLIIILLVRPQGILGRRERVG